MVKHGDWVRIKCDIPSSMCYFRPLRLPYLGMRAKVIAKAFSDKCGVNMYRLKDLPFWWPESLLTVNGRRSFRWK